PMAGSTIPVPHTSLRSIVIASGLHKNSPTSPQMGTTARNTDIGLPRRSDHLSPIQGTVPSLHAASQRQVERTRILGQGSEINVNTNSSDRPSWVHTQLQGHDHHGPSTQDSRHQARGRKTFTQRHRIFKGTFFIRRQGDGNIGSNLSSQADDSQPTSTQKYSTSVPQSQLERQGHHHGASQGEPSVVDRGTEDMEWSVVDPATDADGYLHRRIGCGVGDSYQRPNMGWDMEVDRVSPPHQLERTEDSLASNSTPSHSGQDVERHLRQYDHNRAYKPIRGNEIARIDGPGGHLMETLPSDRDAPQDNI
ncbi:hypothetical protein BGX27_005126, partial [Mortierella sp. AM989]